MEDFFITEGPFIKQIVWKQPKITSPMDFQNDA